MNKQFVTSCEILYGHFAAPRMPFRDNKYLTGTKSLEATQSFHNFNLKTLPLHFNERRFACRIFEVTWLPRTKNQSSILHFVKPKLKIG